MTQPATYTHETPRGAVTIRPTCEADAEAYRALRLYSLQAHPQAFGADYETSSAHPLDYWQERMRVGSGGEHGATYIADAAGALVGMTSLVRNDLAKMRHSANIYGVYTHPEWRGTGVADALLKACIDHARLLALRQLRLGVAVSNAAAVRLYNRAGFTVYGLEPETFFVDGRYYDELLMTKRLMAEQGGEQ